jgi:putative protease
MAAIKAGADSVYFGLGKFNMRSRSSVNFDAKDLNKIMRICRKFGKKAYLTLNVVFFDEDLPEMRNMVDLAKANSVNAIIASDQATIEYAHQSGVEVHLSTQINISNSASLRFYSKYADVAVLARELNLDQVSRITASIDENQIKGPSGQLMKVEMFAHGALCMAVSGKCYLSLHHHNHSANRGECFQDCRRGYLVKDREGEIELEIDNQYIMSPKDLCTIHFLDKILSAGVTVLKMEGRARSPEYVKVVTECYGEAIQSIMDGNYTDDKIVQWKERLSSVFNRGFWDGYYLGQRLGEWSTVYGSKATHKKVYAARCLNYFAKIGIAEFLCEAGTIHQNERIYITGPTTGVIEQKVEEIRVDLKEEALVDAGVRFSMPVSRRVRRGDRLYIVVSAKA